MTKKITTANLSEIQSSFLDAYAKSNDIQVSLKESGMTKGNFNRDSVKDTPFGLEFRMMMSDTLKRYEFSKLSSLNALVKIRDECLKDKDDYGLAINAIKEISKMQEDHLATVKRTEERTNIDVKAIIDFTAPKQIEQEVIDITHKDAD